MARINIDTGSLGNPATGDTLRTAMTKINTNFTEVYSLVRDGSSGLIATDVTNGDLKLQANGTGAIEIDTLSITNSTITSITTNSDITLTPNGTGNVVLGNFTFNADQTVGAGQDNYVFTYDHSTGTIGLEAAASGGVTASSTTTFTNKTFDANGTGNSISNIDIADFTSGVFLDEDNMASNSATAIASQQSIKAYVDSQILTKDNTDEITEGSTNLYFTNTRADARITNALKDEDNMASDSATHVPSQQSVKAYVDAEDANIASDSMTFTNKAGNISQWTNDSNYATQAYVDARDIGDLAVTGSTISAPSNADLTLTTSGTGAVLLGDAIRIRDNHIEGTRSNEDVIIDPAGTGNVKITNSLDVDSITAYSGTNTNLTLAGKGTGYVFVNDRLAVYGNIDLGGDINTSTTTFVSRVDSNIEPDATANNRNLGSSSRKWNTVYASVFDGTLTGTVTGTIDADSSTISNLEVDNFKAATIVLESEGIGSNDNDTTIPTSAAVKDYVDARDIGDLAVTGSTISAPSNADLTLTTSGTGAVLLGDAIRIRDNHIEGTRSNEDVIIDPTGTGNVKIPTDKITLGNSAAAGSEGVAIGKGTAGVGDYAQAIGNNAGNSGQGTAAVALGSQSGETNQGTKAVAVGQYAGQTTQGSQAIAIGKEAGKTTQGDDAVAVGYQAGKTTQGDDAVAVGSEAGEVVQGDSAVAIGKQAGSRYQSDSAVALGAAAGYDNQGDSAVALGKTAGYDNQGDNAVAVGYGAGSFTQGTQATALGNSAGYTTQGASAIAIGYQAGYSNQAANSIVINATGEIVGTTQTDAFIVKPIRNTSGTHQLEYNPTTGEVTYDTLARTGDITFTGSTIQSPSNADITLDPSGTGGVVAQGPVTFNAGYIEKINTLTSSATITVNCALASIHTVTLGTSTEFNITNLPTGGTVTLIITQDGTGSRTATFGTDGSTAVKFPGGTSTLSTGGGDIDVVTIVNDGTNFLGNIAKDYS